MAISLRGCQIFSVAHTIGAMITVSKIARKCDPGTHESPGACQHEN